MKYAVEHYQKVSEFIEYLLEFYSDESDLYPEVNMTREEAMIGTTVLLMYEGENVAFDSVDREKVREIVETNREYL